MSLELDQHHHRLEDISSLSFRVSTLALHRQPTRISLTRQTVCVFRAARLIPPANLSDDLVASREYCYRDEGDEQGEGRGDVPPVKNDTEVRGIPGEEHLGYRYMSRGFPWTARSTDIHVTLLSHIHPSMTHSSMVHTSVVHTPNSRIWASQAGSSLTLKERIG